MVIRFFRILVVLTALVALGFAAPNDTAFAQKKAVHVKEYTKKDGTTVKAHDRSQDTQGETRKSRARQRARAHSTQRRGSTCLREADRVSQWPAWLRHRSHRAARLRRRRYPEQHAVAERGRGDGQRQDRASWLPALDKRVGLGRTPIRRFPPNSILIELLR